MKSPAQTAADALAIALLREAGVNPKLNHSLLLEVQEKIEFAIEQARRLVQKELANETR